MSIWADRKGSCYASEERVRASVDAAYNFTTGADQLNIEPQKLVLYGVSLGTGITTYLAERLATAEVPVTVHAVVLMAPFESVVRAVLSQRYQSPSSSCMQPTTVDLSFRYHSRLVF